MKYRAIISVTFLLTVFLICTSCNNSLLAPKAYYDNLAGIASKAKGITAFSFTVGSAGIIEESKGSISVTVPYSTDVTNLAAVFKTTGKTVSVGGVPQISGVTKNDFTSAVTYTVTARDGSSQTYEVTVTKTVPKSDKEFSSFKLCVNKAGPFWTGVINEAEGKIEVKVPLGTDINAMSAVFTSTGKTVSVGGVPQISGVTENDFTSAVLYTVTAEDGSSKTYEVKVSGSEAHFILNYNGEELEKTLTSTESHTLATIPSGNTDSLPVTLKLMYVEAIPTVTYQNTLFHTDAQNAAVSSSGASLTIPLGYGKNEIKITYKGNTQTLICYSARRAVVAGSGAGLPASLLTFPNTQEAVDGVKDFITSADYTGLPSEKQTLFSPAIIAIAGTDEKTDLSSNYLVEISFTEVQFELRGYDSAKSGVLDAGDVGSVLKLGVGTDVVLAQNLTLSGGSFSEGGGVYSAGSLTLEGVVITANQSKLGGGIYIADGDVNMKDGQITKNSVSGSDSSGGGVYIKKGSFTMSGGSIDTNKALEGSGGGVTIADRSDANFVLTGGSIIANESASKSGGISGLGDGILKIRGNPVVSGNKLDVNASDINVRSAVFKIIGALTGDEKSIGIYFSSPPTTSGQQVAGGDGYTVKSEDILRLKHNLSPAYTLDIVSGWVVINVP